MIVIGDFPFVDLNGLSIIADSLGLIHSNETQNFFKFSLEGQYFSTWAKVVSFASNWLGVTVKTSMAASASILMNILVLGATGAGAFSEVFYLEFWVLTCQS